MVGELLWFLSGKTNNHYLREQNIRIWNEWATEDDELGPIYGEQWRHAPAGEYFNNLTPDELASYIENLASDQCADFESLTGSGGSFLPSRKALAAIGIDQINQAIVLLKTRPDSRRIIVSAWNPQVVPLDNCSPQENVARGRAALAACHTFFQFITEPLTIGERYDLMTQKLGIFSFGHAFEKNLRGYDEAHALQLIEKHQIPTHRLHCSFTCRSQDVFLGTPFNIVSYALLTHMVAQVVNMAPGEIVWHGIDCHIYHNHFDQVKEQLSREPMKLPTLKLNPDVRDLFEFCEEDITLVDYKSHPPIKAQVAV